MTPAQRAVMQSLAMPRLLAQLPESARYAALLGWWHIVDVTLVEDEDEERSGAAPSED